ncbi:MAG: Rid family detoxifying hydrolase [Candidatus Bathyarchaeia archaeon]
MKEIVQTENAPKAVGPYSQAVKAGGFLFVSGQLAIDPKKGEIVAMDIMEQTRQVLENIKSILQAAGYCLRDVVQNTVYLSSMTLFKEFNTEYAKFFSADAPARVTVAALLPLNALVEISTVAYQPIYS